MRRLAVLSILVLAGCSPAAPAPTPATHTVTGTVTTTGAMENGQPGHDRKAACVPAQAGLGLAAGTPVEVRNEANALIGTASLAFGSPATLGTDVGPYTCQFTFTVAGLPDAQFYQLSVGSHAAKARSRAEMDAAGWKYDLGL